MKARQSRAYSQIKGDAVKFNLKNRPILRLADPSLADVVSVIEWFEGFEKELQEEIKGYERVSPARLMEGKDCQKVIIDKLKEILGE